jgi:hypothetical protein
VKVARHVAPGAIAPELKLASSALTVCTTASPLVHSTVVPAGTTMRSSTKA